MLRPELKEINRLSEEIAENVKYPKVATSEFKKLRDEAMIQFWAGIEAIEKYYKLPCFTSEEKKGGEDESPN